MADFIQRIIDEVTAAARRVHGLHSTRSAYQEALAAHLRAEGIPVRTDVTFPEDYGDVEVSHTLDLVAGSLLGVELRSPEEVLPNHYSASLLEFYLSKAGLSDGLVVDFSGPELTVVRVPVPAAHGVTG